MPRPRQPRPAPPPSSSSPPPGTPRPYLPPEDRGTYRQRYKLEREIIRRLEALHLRRLGLSMKRAPGLATGGSARSADEAPDGLED